MIITCPSCSKKYQIGLDSFKGAQRSVRCSGCHHSWTAAKPDSPLEELPVNPQTPSVSAPPKQPANTNPAHPALKPQHQKSPQTPPPQTEKESQPMGPESIGDSQPSSLFAVIRHHNLDWLILVIAGIALAFVLFVQRDALTNLAPQISTFDNWKIVSNDPEILRVEEVNYLITHIEDGSRLVVEGVIYNPSSETQDLPKLKITTWDECLDGKGGYRKCMLRSWNHQLKQTQVPAGSKLSFKAIAPSRGGSIKGAEVTFDQD